MSKKKKETNTRKIKVSLRITDYLKKLDDILENFEALNNTRKIKVSLSITDYLKKLDDILENFEALKRTGFFTGTEMERINSYDMQVMHMMLSKMIDEFKEADQYLSQDIKPQKIKLTFVR